MAMVGPEVLFVHIPRTAGRSTGRMLEAAGLAERCHPTANHEPLADLVAEHGPRPVMFGTIRDPVSWYAAMAVSSLQCHWEQMLPYLRAVTVEERTRGVRWATLIEKMVDPVGWGVEAAPVDGPDGDMLVPLPGLSLYASAYVRTFFPREAWGLPLEVLQANHDALLGPTHLVRMEHLHSELCALPGVGGRIGAEVCYREDSAQVSLEDIYRGAVGERARAAILERDGWLRARHYGGVP